MDVLVIGAISGIFSGFLGKYVKGKSYLFVVVSAIFLSLFLNILFNIYFILSSGFDKWNSKLSSEGFNSPIGVLFFITTLWCIFLFVTFRAARPPPTWDEMQKKFDAEGYEKEIDKNGIKVTYKKGGDIFIAKIISRRMPPSRLEYWKDGRRMSDFVLRE